MSKVRFKILVDYDKKKKIFSEVSQLEGATQISSQRTKSGFDIFFSVRSTEANKEVTKYLKENNLKFEVVNG